MGVVADDRVLPGGDPERVQVPLGLEQGTDLVLESVFRQQARHQVHRPFVEHASGGAVRVAFDPAIGGVGGSGVDPGELQGRAC